jgi:hypothetical protein
MGEPQGVMPAPCKSCPYRKDVPSGVWHEDVYDMLPSYDGEILDQFVNGGTALFLCHQQDGCLCAGWLATHGGDNLVALRLHGGEVKDEVWSYQTPIPVFASGQEARDHGMREIDRPGDRANRTMTRLAKKKGIKLRD